MNGLARVFWNFLVFFVLVLLFLAVITTFIRGMPDFLVWLFILVFYGFLYPLIKR